MSGETNADASTQGTRGQFMSINDVNGLRSHQISIQLHIWRLWIRCVFTTIIETPKEEMYYGRILFQPSRKVQRLESNCSDAGSSGSNRPFSCECESVVWMSSCGLKLNVKWFVLFHFRHHTSWTGYNHHCHWQRSGRVVQYSTSIHASAPMGACVHILFLPQHLPVASQLKAKHWIAHMRLHHQAPQLANSNTTPLALSARPLPPSPQPHSLRPLQRLTHPHRVCLIICFTKRTCYTANIIFEDNKKGLYCFLWIYQMRWKKILILVIIFCTSCYIFGGKSHDVWILYLFSIILHISAKCFSWIFIRIHRGETKVHLKGL